MTVKMSIYYLRTSCVPLNLVYMLCSTFTACVAGRCLSEAIKILRSTFGVYRYVRIYNVRGISRLL